MIRPNEVRFILAVLAALVLAGCGGSKQATEPAIVKPMPEAKRDHGNASVVSLVVTMTFKPEHEQDFLEMAKAAIAQVHEQEPGALLYVLTKHPTEPHTYVWLERYRDAAALEAHGNAPYIKDAKTKLPGWLAKPPQLLKLEQAYPQ